METERVVLAAVLLSLGLASLISPVAAKTCALGTEPDRNAGGKVRFVLPMGDPCACTKVRLGGHNTFAPARRDPPVYLDIMPVVSAEEIRSLIGCAESTAEALTIAPASTPQLTTEGPTTTQESTAASTSDPVTTPAVTTTAPDPAVDCQEIYDNGHTASGVYTIQHGGQPMQVYCRMKSDKGYIVFQRRANGSVSFDRDWQDYADGFGSPDGELWLGNAKLRDMTESGSETWELVITLTSFSDEEAHVRYDEFSLSGADYELDASGYGYEGAINAGDSLTDLHLRFFTTRDEDNDNSGGLNCAVKFQGGWWFKKCNELGSNLNGVYSSTSSVTEYMGIQWVSWKGRHVSLKGCEMMMRRNRAVQ